jgi:hypothetical protein
VAFRNYLPLHKHKLVQLSTDLLVALIFFWQYQQKKWH